VTISVPVVEFIRDHDLLGPFHAGPSWDRWRAVLKAAYALKMTAYDRRLFAEVSGNRPAPKKRVEELDCIVGRGGGKDAVAASLAAYHAVNVDKARLRPGEHAVVLCLAVDRDQAQVAYRYVKGYFEQVPLLAGMVERITADTIDLTNGAEIIIATNSYRAVRGRTICCAILDEIAFWRSDFSQNPDAEVDAAISPGLARWPGSIKILISTPYRKAGLLWQRYKESFGQADDDCLVVHGETRAFNPLFPQLTVDRELRRDRDKAKSEYLAQWREDITSFIALEAIEACVDESIRERPRERSLSYCAFCDPSGGRGDSFCLAIAHKTRDGLVVIDAIREVPSPCVPAKVVREFAGTLKSYGLRQVWGDDYGAEWVAAEFRDHGIQYRSSEHTAGENYLIFLPILNSARVSLLDHERSINQLASLERRVTRSGRDVVDHPQGPGAHDDLACVIAGVSVVATGKPGPLRFSPQAIAWSKRPGPRADMAASTGFFRPPGSPYDHFR
jgi:hypothetical protein